jgi:hypothetical protein
MDKHELAVIRGEQAQALRANPIFDKALADTRQAILESWAELRVSDTEEARDLHRMLKCLERVKRCINIHIDTGKIAQAEIDGRANRLNPFRRAK